MEQTREILVVGDSRVRNLKIADNSGWRVKVESYSGIPLRPLLRNADSLIGSETRILIIVGLFCDFSTFPDCMPNGGHGLLRAKEAPDYTHLMNLITTYDFRWRTQYNLTVVWTLPHQVDYLQFNEHRQTHKFRMENLNEMQRYEAQDAARVMRANLKHIAELMRDPTLSLTLFELAHYSPDVSQETGGDGIHMGDDCKDYVFYAVCQDATRRYPVPRPTRVGTYMSPQERDVVKQRRERQALRRELLRDPEVSNTRGRKRTASHSASRRHDGPSTSSRRQDGNSYSEGPAHHRGRDFSRHSDYNRRRR